jgi:bacterioferritin (cytochrome b1)
MTNREFFAAIVSNPSLSAEMHEHAEKEIARIDATNEKAAAKRAEKAAEDQPLLDALAAALTEEPQTASTLKDVIECSVQKTSSLLRKLVAADRAVAEDVVIPKKGKQKGYKAV